LGSFKGWALAHKGKATSTVDFNPEDPPESYSNPAVHSRISEYTSMARDVHGPEWNPDTEDIDGELAMRLGGGKKHGRYWIGNSVVDTASTPTLSQIRARSTSSSPAIRTPPSTTQSQLQALQVSSLSFVVHCFLHMYVSQCNIGVKFCRPSWMKRIAYGRRIDGGWRRIDGDYRSNNSGYWRGWHRRWVHQFQQTCSHHLRQLLQLVLR
jgi:hypothetical protein